MYLFSYIRSAEEIIKLYNGSIPFAAWLKTYFKQHKKFGSKDRKVVTDLCYCYYRLGTAFAERTIEDRLLIAQLLCNDNNVFVNELRPEWKAIPSLSLKDKIDFIGDKSSFSLFPFIDEVSDQIEKDLFIESHLIQPDLFLRLRPGKRDSVLQKLKMASIQFVVEDDCIRLPNMSKIDTILDLDTDVVIQDKNSQKVLDTLRSTASGQPPTFASWDCCAASGGKTILLHDKFPKAQLTVSDIRESILHNLKSRFSRAGIRHYHSFVADVSSSSFSLNKKFDLVICDAPCSGSGTWSRTPEQISFLPKEKIAHYANLQKRIALNAGKYVKEGGYFLYITCSVFKKENEEVSDFITNKTGMKLLNQQYFKGYTEKADTLFAALFSL